MLGFGPCGYDTYGFPSILNLSDFEVYPYLSMDPLLLLSWLAPVCLWLDLCSYLFYFIFLIWVLKV